MSTAIVIMGLRGSGKTTLEYNLHRLLIPDWPNPGDHSVGENVCFFGPVLTDSGYWCVNGGAEKIMRGKWVEPPRNRLFYVFTGTTGEANNVKAHEFIRGMDIREFVLHTPGDEEWLARLRRRSNQSYVPQRRVLRPRYPNGRVLHWNAAWTAICSILGVYGTPLTLEELYANHQRDASTSTET